MKRKTSNAPTTADTPAGKWRIVRGDEVLATFASAELARNQFFRLSRAVAGHGAGCSSLMAAGTTGDEAARVSSAGTSFPGAKPIAKGPA